MATTTNVSTHTPHNVSAATSASRTSFQLPCPQFDLDFHRETPFLRSLSTREITLVVGSKRFTFPNTEAVCQAAKFLHSKEPLDSARNKEILEAFTTETLTKKSAGILASLLPDICLKIQQTSNDEERAKLNEQRIELETATLKATALMQAQDLFKGGLEPHQNWDSAHAEFKAAILSLNPRQPTQNTNTRSEGILSYLPTVLTTFAMLGAMIYIPKESSKFCAESAVNIVVSKLCLPSTQNSSMQIIKQTAQNSLQRIGVDWLISKISPSDQHFFGRSVLFIGRQLRPLFIRSNAPFHIAQQAISSKVSRQVATMKTAQKFPPLLKQIASIVASNAILAGALWFATKASDRCGFNSMSQHLRGSMPTLTGTGYSLLLTALPSILQYFDSEASEPAHA